jgi:hypothetical protein
VSLFNIRAAVYGTLVAAFALVLLSVRLDRHVATGVGLVIGGVVVAAIEARRVARTRRNGSNSTSSDADANALAKFFLSIFGHGSLRRHLLRKLRASAGVTEDSIEEAWRSHPRLITMSFASAAFILCLLPWASGWDLLAPTPASEFGSVAGTLVGIEAVMFTLTAAITALLLAVSLEPDERASLIERYRSRAFDAIAVFSLAVILLTGFGLLTATSLSSQARVTGGTTLSLGFLFGLDVIGLAWLLFYSHHLIQWTYRQRLPEMLRELHSSFIEAALRDQSVDALLTWGRNYPVSVMSIPLAAPTDATIVRATAAGYVVDISLDRLAAWLQSLQGTVSMGRLHAKAIFFAQLNVWIDAGRPLAMVSKVDSEKGADLLDSLKFNREIPEDRFQHSLGLLRDRTASAVKEGLLEQFDANLKTFLALERALFQLLTDYSDVSPGLQTQLIGWPPQFFLRNAIHRLGPEVLNSGSVAAIRRWLYFPQEVLAETRDLNNRDVRPLLFLWEQVALRRSVPDEWDFWGRQNHYVTSVNIAFGYVRDREGLQRLDVEVFAYLQTLRIMVAALEPSYFGRVQALVDELGRGLASTWDPGFEPSADLAEGRASLSSILQSRKLIFWLGYAGWLLRRIEESDVVNMKETALSQWRQIERRYFSLPALWDALQGLRSDPFQWDWEDSEAQRKEAEASGRRVWGGFADSYQLGVRAFIILGARLAANAVFVAPREAALTFVSDVSPDIDLLINTTNPSLIGFLEQCLGPSWRQVILELRQRFPVPPRPEIKDA